MSPTLPGALGDRFCPGDRPGIFGPGWLAGDPGRLGVRLSVMTSGVAPRASAACTLRMDSRPTTLTEFVDDVDGDGSGESDGSPTPEQNAASINHLVACVEQLTEQVGTIADELGQRDTTNRIETEPADAERMFQ